MKITLDIPDEHIAAAFREATEPMFHGQKKTAISHWASALEWDLNGGQLSGCVTELDGTRHTLTTLKLKEALSYMLDDPETYNTVLTLMRGDQNGGEGDLLLQVMAFGEISKFPD